MQNKIVQHSLLFTVILLVFVSLFPLITAYRYPAFLNDDSYITLTYAKNLASGNGFVFNHSPAVLGTTTPLFTIAVAGLALIFPKTDIPVLAVFLTAFCWLGIVWTIFFFRKEWGLENWQVCTLALVLIGSGWIGSLGMEAYPFAFLLFLSLSLFLRKRYWLTGFIAGLLFLTRGEGVLVLAVLSIAIPIQHWVTKKPFDIELVRNILKLVVGFTLPVLLWVIYAHITFGSFLPNTLAAKQAQAQTGLWRPFLKRLTNEWMPLWGKSLTFEIIPFVNFWWVIVLIGFIDVLLRKRRWLILVGWITLYISGYILLNVSAYWWYELPILFVLTLFFGLGIVMIVEILTRLIKPNNLSLGISVLFTIVLVFVLAKPTFNAMLAYQGDTRGESYTALSRWFREHTYSSESIAFIEIGYLGYYTNNRIIDLAGLVLPDVPPHIAEGDFAWSFWQYKPDYYVYLSDFDWALASIRADPRFDQQYQPVATLRGPRETDFIIYERISQ
jgi:arabinofuranosyltransferase